MCKLLMIIQVIMIGEKGNYGIPDLFAFLKNPKKKMLHCHPFHILCVTFLISICISKSRYFILPSTHNGLWMVILSVPISISNPLISQILKPKTLHNLMISTIVIVHTILYAIQPSYDIFLMLEDISKYVHVSLVYHLTKTLTPFIDLLFMHQRHKFLMDKPNCVKSIGKIRRIRSFPLQYNNDGIMVRLDTRKNFRKLFGTLSLHSTL